MTEEELEKMESAKWETLEKISSKMCAEVKVNDLMLNLADAANELCQWAERACMEKFMFKSPSTIEFVKSLTDTTVLMMAAAEKVKKDNEAIYTAVENDTIMGWKNRYYEES